MDLPTGTVTFLFVEIEGGERIWESFPTPMTETLDRYRWLVRAAVESSGGSLFKTAGVSCYAAFTNAAQAVRAAVDAQLALLAEAWEPRSLKARMSLYTGVAELREGDYFGPALNRAARLLAAAHGGQILLGEVTRSLVRDDLPPQVTLKDLGSHRLRDLARPEPVAQAVHPQLPADLPPLISLDIVPNNLPEQNTSFIGRQTELSAVKHLLQKGRLLTITGAGGCGKTRLALQAAADVSDAYSDGVWLVELAGLTEADLIPQAIAQALGVLEQPGRTLIQTLVDTLTPRHLLLVLDNCEHLLPGCALLVDRLLHACLEIKVLATSREWLAVAGEQTFRVPSLTVPDPHLPLSPESLQRYEAARLFIERASLTRSDFSVTAENAPALATVCRRLDGIPLAIELAAARVRSLAVEEINARLDDRFQLLTGGSRTALPRQQTLRALIDWSYNLLSDQERALLQRLAVFAGGWTLEAAEAVAGKSDEETANGRYADTPPSSFPAAEDVLDLLTSLVDKSLVIYDGREGLGRYQMLETVRQYAAERLQESGADVGMRGRHRDYFLRFAEQAKPKLQGSEQRSWLERLEADHDNFRAALAWCAGLYENPRAATHLANALYWFWYTRGYLTEGRRWLSYALLRDRPGDPALRAKALNCAGNLASLQDDLTEAEVLYRESLTINQALQDEAGIAIALGNCARIAYLRKDHAAAKSLFEQSLSIKRRLGNPREISISLNNLANVYRSCGDYGMAKPLYQEFLAIQRSSGDNLNVSYALRNLGDVATAEGDPAAALPLLEEALALRRDLGDRRGIAYALISLVEALNWLRQWERARPLGEEAIALMRQVGDGSGLVEALTVRSRTDRHCGDLTAALKGLREALTRCRELESNKIAVFLLDDLAVIACQRGQPERTAQLYGAADAARSAMQSPNTPIELTERRRIIAAARALCEQTEWDAAYQAGEQLTLDQAISMALAFIASVS